MSLLHVHRAITWPDGDTPRPLHLVRQDRHRARARRLEPAMTPDLLAYLARQPGRCKACGAHVGTKHAPGTQPHATNCPNRQGETR